MKKSRLGLLQTQILDILTQSELDKFEYKNLPKTSIIYAEEIKIIILKSGCAKLSFFEDGEEFILYRLEANNIAVLDDNCAFEILEDAKIYSINLSEISEILSNVNVVDEILKAVLNAIIVQRQIIKSILFEDAKGRIANFLIELAREQDLKQNGYHYLFLPFSLKVLSSFVGLKRQSASTAFNELIKDDIIRKITPHEFLIIDYEKLESYTN
ncbi:Crp/Fnr family transcriptional regulator [Campylobacter concisus]|uniref:Cro/Cl family transcriptional regulator n=1 Tax=Campylobacter concisus TaxID=199 RepID=A0A1X0U1Q0_9BACT|nr:Crp/Fnr family transcriptional regulator [Campylobacter concisus]ORI07202.1 Cro/Cl family transcriptional regulator [Campylobacter concisus]